MNAIQIQAAIDSISRTEILAALLLGSLLLATVRFTLYMVKHNNHLKHKLEALARHTAQSDYLEDLSSSKITIERLQIQVKTYQHELASIKQLNLEQRQATLAKPLSKATFNEALKTVKQPVSLTNTKIQQLNQHQRAQYHYRLKQAKQFSQQPHDMRIEHDGKPYKNYTQQLLKLNMNTEHRQLIELLHEA